eukprot:8236651-Pyramimonas_sp.AAC.1
MRGEGRGHCQSSTQRGSCRAASQHRRVLSWGGQQLIFFEVEGVRSGLYSRHHLPIPALARHASNDAQ